MGNNKPFSPATGVGVQRHTMTVSRERGAEPRVSLQLPGLQLAARLRSAISPASWHLPLKAVVDDLSTPALNGNPAAHVAP